MLEHLLTWPRTTYSNHTWPRIAYSNHQAFICFGYGCWSKEWRCNIVTKELSGVNLLWFATLQKMKPNWNVMMTFHWSYILEISTAESCNHPVISSYNLHSEVIFGIAATPDFWQTALFISTETSWSVFYVTKVETTSQPPAELSSIQSISNKNWQIGHNITDTKEPGLIPHKSTVNPFNKHGNSN